MTQQLRILQSLWAMERRRADAAEWPLQTQLAMIRDAGFVPKICLLICVKDADKDKAVKAIAESARTGAVGDGKIFVLSASEVLRIRTGERDEAAI